MLPSSLPCETRYVLEATYFAKGIAFVDGSNFLGDLKFFSFVKVPDNLVPDDAYTLAFESSGVLSDTGQKRAS